jgi:L-lactate dehydrogenase complex protein LldG
MMPDARDRILAAVRDGLVRAVLPDAGGDAVPRWPPPSEVSPDALVAQFSAALTTLSGHVYHADTASDVADIVARIAADERVSSCLSWDEEHLGCPGVLAAIESRGLARVTYDVPGDTEPRLRTVQDLAGVGIGLTGAHAGLADCGAMVLPSGPGRGRLASLLPPVHVAILSRRRIRPSLAALVREEPRLLDLGSNVVLVAGPSRTADIEMTLSHGVHGPKQVHVILTP